MFSHYTLLTDKVSVSTLFYNPSSLCSGAQCKCYFHLSEDSFFLLS